MYFDWFKKNNNIFKDIQINNSKISAIESNKVGDVEENRNQP